jgi:cell division septation protein DedD
MTTDARDIRENDEDGFHEIQLSGKQLVFLCMATTVVSIVIFLCGVLVGRGVRPVEAVAEAAAVSATDSVPADTSVPVDTTPAGGASAPAANEPTPTPDVPPGDEPADKPAPAAAASAPLTPAPPAAAPVNTPPPAPAAVKKPEPTKADVAAAKPVPPPPAATPAPAPAAAAPTAAIAATREPAAPKPAAEAPAASAAPASAKGGVIAVQVGAYRERVEADALAKKLTGKGYAVYIVSPDANAANPMFRVRVGNYTSQDEASRVKRRLEQEEKLKPWIIR